MAPQILCAARGANAPATTAVASILADRIGADCEPFDGRAADSARAVMAQTVALKAEMLVVPAWSERRRPSRLVPALLREAPCPIVLAPARPMTPPDEGAVVCGIDGSERSLNGVRLAADLAARLDAELRLLHATETEGAQRYTDMERALAVAGVTARGYVQAIPPWLGLLRLAEFTRAQCVVVAGRPLGRVGRVVRGSVSRRLERWLTIPTIVLPDSADLHSEEHYRVGARWQEPVHV